MIWKDLTTNSSSSSGWAQNWLSSRWLMGFIQVWKNANILLMLISFEFRFSDHNALKSTQEALLSLSYIIFECISQGQIEVTLQLSPFYLTSKIAVNHIPISSNQTPHQSAFLLKLPPQFFSFGRRMKCPSSIFIFLYLHSHNRVMNRVSPIIDDAHESSADSIHRRLEIRVTNYTHCTAQEEGTGPRTCKICLEEEVGKDAEGVPVGDEEGNAMIIPCDCRGSVGYVHQKCIKMWIEKQFQGGKTKRAYCEICKSQIFFKKVKVRYCDCHLANLCQISPCNVVCIVAEIILVAVVSLVQFYVDRAMNFQLLRNSLLALLGILSLTLFLTVFLVLKEVFVKTYKEIERIYSVAESEQLGLKEPRCRQEPTAMTCISRRPKIVMSRKGRQSKINTRLSNVNHFQSIIPQLVVGHS